MLRSFPQCKIIDLFSPPNPLLGVISHSSSSSPPAEIVVNPFSLSRSSFFCREIEAYLFLLFLLQIRGLFLSPFFLLPPQPTVPRIPSFFRDLQHRALPLFRSVIFFCVLVGFSCIRYGTPPPFPRANLLPPQIDPTALSLPGASWKFRSASVLFSGYGDPPFFPP